MSCTTSTESRRARCRAVPSNGQAIEINAAVSVPAPRPQTCVTREQGARVMLAAALVMPSRDTPSPSLDVKGLARKRLRLAPPCAAETRMCTLLRTSRLARVRRQRQVRWHRSECDGSGRELPKPRLRSFVGHMRRGTPSPSARTLPGDRAVCVRCVAPVPPSKSSLAVRAHAGFERLRGP